MAITNDYEFKNNSHQNVLLRLPFIIEILDDFMLKIINAIEFSVNELIDFLEAGTFNKIKDEDFTVIIEDFLKKINSQKTFIDFLTFSKVRNCFLNNEKLKAVAFDRLITLIPKKQEI